MTDYAEISKKTHVALITESWRESVARDLSTATIILALWSLGHFAESAALEWVGVLLGIVLVFGRAVALFKGTMDKRMTPKEARAWLDRNFPEHRT